MAGKHRKSQLVNRSSESANTEQGQSNTSNNTERSSRISSKRRPKINSENSNLESVAIKRRSDSNLSSIQSTETDTGGHISKRRRRETPRSNTFQTAQSSSVIEPSQSVPHSSNSVVTSDSMASSAASTNPTRRRRAPLKRCNATGVVDQPTTSSNNNAAVASSSKEPRVGKGKSSSKNKNKFPQFNLTSSNRTNESSNSGLSSDSALQGIMSSGVDLSQFQNYLNSRSLTNVDIGEQINRKTEELRSSNGDRTQEYMSLTEINQHLLVSYEDSLSSLRVGELVTQVINIIQNCDDNLVDLKTICYNVLLHLMEAQPRSSDYLVTSIPTLLKKISNLFDFDSLEQIINVIERISRRHGHAVLQSGAFTTIITYYDFLTAPQQLTILSMINQCFQTIRPGSNTDFSQLLDGIDNLISRLKQSESKCVEKVIQCLIRLVRAYQNDSLKLKRIANNSSNNSTLFTNLQELLICSPPIVQDCREIIQMMSLLCANCPDLAVTLIKQNITQTLLCVCCSNTTTSTTSTSAPKPSSSTSTPNTNNPINTRSPEEILAIITLISELMPPLPKTDFLFIINKILYSNMICNNSSNQNATNNNNSEYLWYWYNINNHQWIEHSSSISQLFDDKLENGQFEFTCQPNNSNLSTTITVNLLIMQQVNEQTGIVNDLIRGKYQNNANVKLTSSIDDKDSKLSKDSRTIINQEQCGQFGNNQNNLEVIEMIQSLFPLIIDIYNEATSVSVKYKCLEALLRIIYPTSAKVLNNVLNKASLSSLLATLLSSKDAGVIIAGIQMGILLQKLPDSLIVNFKKEGVLYQLEKMLDIWKNKECENSTSPPPLPPTTSTSSSHIKPNSISVIPQISGFSSTTPDPALSHLIYRMPTSTSTGGNYPRTYSNYMPTNIPLEPLVTPTISTQTATTSVAPPTVTSASQKLANWMKKTACIGKPAAAAVVANMNSQQQQPQSIANQPSDNYSHYQQPQPSTSTILSNITSGAQQNNKPRKSRGMDQALDMSLRNRHYGIQANPSNTATPSSSHSFSSYLIPTSLPPPPPPPGTSHSHCPLSSGSTTSSTTPSATSSSTRKISQIMNLLNLHQQQYELFPPNSTQHNMISSHQSSPQENIQPIPFVNKEYQCKQWILKFGNRLDKSWKQNGRQETVKISSELIPLIIGTQQNNVDPSTQLNNSMDILFCLTQIAKDLQNYNDSILYDNAVNIEKSLILYSELLTRGYYVSVFEMESSGIMEALLRFLTASGSQFTIQRQLMNLKLFLKVFGTKSQSSNTITTGSPLGCLINNLLICLHQQEQFHVRIFQLPNLNSAGSTPSPGQQTSNEMMGNSSNNALGSNFMRNSQRFNLTQVLTDAVFDRWRAHHRRGIPTNTDPPDSYNLPFSYNDRHSQTAAAMSALSAAGFLISTGNGSSSPSNKLTDVHCCFSAYPHEVHATDKETGAQRLTGTDNTTFNVSFETILDVLATIGSLEKTVLREITKNRRIHKKIGLISSKEISSMHESSGDDDEDDEDDEEEIADEDDDEVDDYGDGDELVCELGSSNYEGGSPSGILNDEDDELGRREAMLMAASISVDSAGSGSVKSRRKQVKSTTGSSSSRTTRSTAAAAAAADKSGPSTTTSNVTKKANSGSIKPYSLGLVNRIRTFGTSASQSSTSSSNASTLITSNNASKKPSFTSLYNSTTFQSSSSITRVQILINDVILSPDMSLYQALRRYSSHVIQFLTNSSNQIAGKTEQQIEDSINQIIWRYPHVLQYRIVHLPSTSASGLTNTSTINKHNLPKLINPPPITAVEQSVTTTTTQSHIMTRARRNTKKSATTASPTTMPTSTSRTNTVTSKRRRKNTSSAATTLSTQISHSPLQNNHASILIDNLSPQLPYPVLIDFPAIFEPLPTNLSLLNSTSNSTNSTPQDCTSNIPHKLDTTLSLLRCLYKLSRHYHLLSHNLNSNSLVPDSEFRSPKLTSKVNRQLQDIFYVLAHNIPFWCIQLMYTCAFLFSLETRQNFFYLFSFNRPRTLLYLQGANNADSPDNFLESSSEIRRLRVTVNRSERLLDDAELLLKNQTDPRTLLEISFSNEVGFGLGPTNEFYTQLSKALMKLDLQLWYVHETVEQNSDIQYVTIPNYGLYPKPLGKNKKLDSKTRNKFLFIGRLLSRALLDCRKLDLPLNPVFYKWLLGQQDSITCADLGLVDSNLSKQLRDLYDLAHRKSIIDNDSSLNSNQKKRAIEELGVEDLQIVFVHPIYTDIELMKDGVNRVVSASDLHSYLQLITSWTLIDGVRSQMEAVIEGFDSILPGARCHLSQLFGAHEVEEVFCGSRCCDDDSTNNNDGWDVKTLTEVCHCDHGYTMNSRSIINLFEIMSEFSREQRRQFVQFCTGTPRLPVGGFRALKPPFKIVNKKEGNENPDNYLPSVMTCQNFLKLPDYSSKEIMRQRLLYALHEGQNAFHLS